MILIVDNYDSFVHNVARYFEELGEATRVVRNDEVTAQDLSAAKLVHYTVGVPGIKHYARCDGALHWHRAHRNMNTVPGE